MKKTVKLICMALALAMIIGALGCTGSPSTQQPTATPEATQSVTAEPTEVPTPEPSPTPDPSIAKIILLLGQSNAVGATLHNALSTTVGKDKTKEYTKGYDNVRMLYFAEAGGANGKNYQTNFKLSTNPTIIKLFDKVKLGMSWTNVCFGPEVGMAEYLTTNCPDDTFYIIKVAKGGVGINDTFLDGQYCWEKMEEIVSAAIEMFIAEGYKPQISGICWMQGENEACAEKTANEYLTYQADLAKRLREKYADYAPKGGIPFIDAGISSYWKYYKTVNAKKVEFANSSELNYYFDTMELGYTYNKEPAGSPDLAHFDSECVVKLGQKFAEVFYEAYIKVR